MKRGYLFNKASSVVDDDSDSDTPFDPSTIFGNILKKENEIKVDGNKVYFHKEVSRDSILQLISTLKQTIKKVKNTSEYIGVQEPVPIYLFVNSGGGDYFAGMSGYDHIRSLNYPIYTVIDGMTASAGTFITLAGTKRYMLKNSWVLIHQIKTWFQGYYTFEETKDDMANTSNFMKSLNDLYLNNTKITKKKLDTFFKHDLYIGSSEALELGVIDGIYGEPMELPDEHRGKRQKRS
jgi:ATP-dependent protease ClpP protease subunit